jgi:hypothetical protein
MSRRGTAGAKRFRRRANTSLTIMKTSMIIKMVVIVRARGFGTSHRVG